jgi:hypothetical protein
MNMYYFTYCMMDVWSALEGTAKIKEEQRKRANKRRCFIGTAVTVHVGSVLAAAGLFMYLLSQ